MRTSLTTLTLVTLLLCPGATQSQSIRTLDLTAHPELTTADEELSASSRDGGTASVSRKTLSLRLRLIDLDRPRYERGDSVVFTVLIENTGQSPVTIPWSLASGELRRSPLRQTRRAALGLYLKDKLGQLHPAAGVVLMGAPGIRDSTITLRPGEQAKIKAPSSWVLDEATAAWLTSVTPAPVQVVAGMNVSEGDDVTFKQSSHLVSWRWLSRQIDKSRYFESLSSDADSLGADNLGMAVTGRCSKRGRREI